MHRRLSGSVLYRLCAVKGFGFLTVDEIAKKCNGMLNDPIRISGCISYVLKAGTAGGAFIFAQGYPFISGNGSF